MDGATAGAATADGAIPRPVACKNSRRLIGVSPVLRPYAGIAGNPYQASQPLPRAGDRGRDLIRNFPDRHASSDISADSSAVELSSSLRRRLRLGVHRPPPPPRHPPLPPAHPDPITPHALPPP